ALFWPFGQFDTSTIPAAIAGRGFALSFRCSKYLLRPAKKASRRSISFLPCLWHAPCPMLWTKRSIMMRETVMRMSLVLTVALATGGAQGRLRSDKAGLVYPVVPGHGGVVPLPR